VDKRNFLRYNQQFDGMRRRTINLSGLRSVLFGLKVWSRMRVIYTCLEAIAHAPRMNRSVEIGSYEYEVCGQGNVINLFRDEDKRGKKMVAMRADRKGNFARE
jgi:hypothetical protein